MISPEYVGDVVVFSGIDVQSRIVRYYTRSIWSHVSLRLERSIVRGSSLFREDRIIDLLNPGEDYDKYLILRHKGITDSKRKDIIRIEYETPMDYDIRLILKQRNRLKKNIPMDDKDIGRPNRSICTQRIGEFYLREELKIKDGVHSSQLLPHHFPESPYFDPVGQGLRENGHWRIDWG